MIDQYNKAVNEKRLGNTCRFRNQDFKTCS